MGFKVFFLKQKSKGMYKINILVLSFALFILNDLLLAQQVQNKHSVQSFMGSSILINKKSTGISIGASYGKLFERGKLSISLSHFRATSDHNISKYKNYNLFYRDFNNPNPNDNPFLWSRESFSGVNLRSHPNRFFAIDISLSYCFLNKINKKMYVYYGLGGALSWRDDIEIVKVVYVREMWTPTSKYYDIYLPVFRYRNYLDFSPLVISGVKYNLIDQIYMDFGLDMRYFPFSNDWWFRSIFSFGFEF